MGFYRVLLGYTEFSTGFYRVSPGFTRFYGVLPSFTGFYWVLIEFYRFSRSINQIDWVCLCFISYHKIVLGFTGFCRVLLIWMGFTGFYWESRRFYGFFFFWPIFTGFNRVLLDYTELPDLSKRVTGFVSSMILLFYRVFVSTDGDCDRRERRHGADSSTPFAFL